MSTAAAREGSSSDSTGVYERVGGMCALTQAYGGGLGPAPGIGVNERVGGSGGGGGPLGKRRLREGSSAGPSTGVAARVSAPVHCAGGGPTGGVECAGAAPGAWPGGSDVLPEATAAPTGLGGGGGGRAPATGAPANEPSTEKASTCSTSCCMGVWRAGCGGSEVESGWRSPAGRGDAEAPAELTTPSPNGVPLCASLAARKVARRAACARRVDGERWRCGECCPGEPEADGGRWRGGEKDGSDGDGEGLRRCASRRRLAGWCWWGQWWCGGRWEG